MGDVEVKAIGFFFKDLFFNNFFKSNTAFFLMIKTLQDFDCSFMQGLTTNFCLELEQKF